MADFGNEARLTGDPVNVSLENVTIGFGVVCWLVFSVCGLLVAYRRRYGVPAWHCGRLLNTQTIVATTLVGLRL